MRGGRRAEEAWRGRARRVRSGGRDREEEYSVVLEGSTRSISRSGCSATSATSSSKGRSGLPGWSSRGEAARLVRLPPGLPWPPISGSRGSRRSPISAFKRLASPTSRRVFSPNSRSSPQERLRTRARSTCFSTRPRTRCKASATAERLDPGVLDILGRASALFAKGGTRLTVGEAGRARGGRSGSGAGRSARSQARLRRIGSRGSAACSIR